VLPQADPEVGATYLGESSAERKLDAFPDPGVSESSGS